VGQEQDDIQQAINEAKELIKMLETTSVRRVSLEAGSFNIEVERTFAEGPSAPRAPDVIRTPEAAHGGGARGHHQVLSPMVGTFYNAPSPGAKPFVEVGSRVERGQAIGIVEAMKVMNEVPSDVSGTVTEILASNGQPVQYEEPLMIIDTGS
jgi:acetyl-CoA carboxylase biotin carboxyl carrier protein